MTLGGTFTVFALSVVALVALFAAGDIRGAVGFTVLALVSLVCFISVIVSKGDSDVGE